MIVCLYVFLFTLLGTYLSFSNGTVAYCGIRTTWMNKFLSPEINSSNSSLISQGIKFHRVVLCSCFSLDISSTLICILLYNSINLDISSSLICTLRAFEKKILFFISTTCKTVIYFFVLFVITLSSISGLFSLLFQIFIFFVISLSSTLLYSVLYLTSFPYQVAFPIGAHELVAFCCSN